MSNMAFKAIVRGKVQNVWFRKSTQEQAEKLNICGWAKNLPNGDVEVVAYGKNTEQLAKWLHHGPNGARVDAVDFQEIASTSDTIPGNFLVL